MTEDATLDDVNASDAACPVMHTLSRPTEGSANQEWWPTRLNLRILASHQPVSNPMSGDDFDYVKEFESLDLDRIDLGSGKRVIAKGGVYDKKYQITIPAELKND